MKVHKDRIDKRETVCGIEYEGMDNLWDFLTKFTAGHWRKVTCKKCHKGREYYEKRANRKPR